MLFSHIHDPHVPFMTYGLRMDLTAEYSFSPAARSLWFKKITIFDVYEGDKLPKDKKSIALRVLLQPQEKTFTDEEIENISKKIIDLVTTAFEATLRN